jgi:hypothetical protein
MLLKSRLSLVAPIVALAMLVSANFASAQKTDTVTNGSTNITLASTVVPALTSAGISLGTQSGTSLHSGVIDLSAIGGAVDLDTGNAQVIHNGGINLTAGSNKVILQSLMIDTTNGAAIISGLVSVNGVLLGRMPIFDLSVSSALTFPFTTNNQGRLTVTGIDVTLDSTIAGLLNSTFTSAGNPFAGGITIGTAVVQIYLTAS